MRKNTFAKLMIALALVAACLNTAQAKKRKETGGAKPAFDKGSKTIGFLIGFGVDYSYGYGYYGYGGYTTSLLPLGAITYDQGIIANAGPGTVGVGGIIAYKPSSSSYQGYKDYYNSFIIGARGTYHLTLLKDKNRKFDPYGGVTIGIRSSRYSNSYNSTTNTSVSPVAGAFVGAKYNFATHVGAFAELGYDVSVVRIGICVNF